MAQHGQSNVIVKDAINMQAVNTKAGIFVSSKIPTNEQKSHFITAGIHWDRKSPTLFWQKSIDRLFFKGFYFSAFWNQLEIHLCIGNTNLSSWIPIFLKLNFFWNFEKEYFKMVFFLCISFRYWNFILIHSFTKVQNKFKFLKVE